MILLMEEILHQLIVIPVFTWVLYIHLKWCRISSINTTSIYAPCMQHVHAVPSDILIGCCLFVQGRSVNKPPHVGLIHLGYVFLEAMNEATSAQALKESMPMAYGYIYPTKVLALSRSWQHEHLGILRACRVFIQ